MKLLSILMTLGFFFSTPAFAVETISIAVPGIQVQQRLSYSFGRVWVNSLNRVLYQIKNVGAVAIEREGFSISGHGFDAFTNCPKLMDPGLVCDLEIRYWPAFEGMHFGRMYMLFTDKNDLVIDLYGQAYRY